MPTINLSKDEITALQKKLGNDNYGALRGVVKKVDEAIKAQERLENIKYNSFF